MPLKIYGQTLPEIFKKMPLPHKIIVVAGALFIAMCLVMIPLQYHYIKNAKKGSMPISILSSNDHSFDIFDPSIAMNTDKSIGILAYSSLEPSKDQKNNPTSLVLTRLAFTGGKNCVSWISNGIGFISKPDDILAPDGYSVLAHGVWRVETSSVVYDPDDKGHEWKLFAYKYFWSDNKADSMSLARRYGMIVYKDASDPKGEWSQEKWLFSAAPDYPPPPYEQMVPLHLNSLSPELQDVTTYSRPSVIYKEGYLVMTLSAFKGGETTPDRIIMIISKDHGRHWQYIGSVLQKSDAAKLGDYTVLSGATLVEQDGKVYLAAVFGDNEIQGRGSFIFGFDRLGRGLLKRDSKGVPVLLNKISIGIDTPVSSGGSFIAYNDYCSSGALASQQIMGTTSFKIYKTYKKPVEK